MLGRPALRPHFIPGATLALTRQPRPFSPAGPLMYEWPHSSATEADDRAHFIAGSRNPDRYFSSQQSDTFLLRRKETFPCRGDSVVRLDCRDSSWLWMMGLGIMFLGGGCLQHVIFLCPMENKSAVVKYAVTFLGPCSRSACVKVSSTTGDPTLALGGVSRSLGVKFQHCPPP